MAVAVDFFRCYMRIGDVAVANDAVGTLFLIIQRFNSRRFSNTGRFADAAIKAFLRINLPRKPATLGNEVSILRGR